MILVIPSYFDKKYVIEMAAFPVKPYYVIKKQIMWIESK